MDVILVVMVMLDVVLSVVNFFAFTTDSQNEVETLFASLTDAASDAWCARARCV